MAPSRATTCSSARRGTPHSTCASSTPWPSALRSRRRDRCRPTRSWDCPFPTLSGDEGRLRPGSLARVSRSGLTVLDLGAGTGRFAVLLAARETTPTPVLEAIDLLVLRRQTT